MLAFCIQNGLPCDTFMSADHSGSTYCTLKGVPCCLIVCGKLVLLGRYICLALSILLLRCKSKIMDSVQRVHQFSVISFAK